jgi:hypothetical protein
VHRTQERRGRTKTIGEAREQRWGMRAGAHGDLWLTL